MKLATFRAPGTEGPLAGQIEGELVMALAGGVSVMDVLAGAPVQLGGGEWSLSEVELLAPIPHPGTIFAIGLNYSRHVKETGGQRPEAPIVFLKAAGSIAPPSGPVRCPAVVRRLDYEGELTIVIGAGGRIGGYCVANDVSARDLQRREPQWGRAKGADSFCPFGPWVTTVDEFGESPDLRLRTWVNGELRQDGRTSEMTFSPAELVEFIGETCTLSPGDLILTGTPSGVGMALDPPRFLQGGDVVRIEIERLGAIEHPVVAV